MSGTAFIICEYNPFHNGHAYQLQKTKEHCGGAVICVMSGNFTQRGEPAVFEKQIRAAAAIKAGADLVLELPLKYAVSGAEEFAGGAMELIKATGLKGTLSFGATAQKEELERLSALLQSESVTNRVTQQIKTGGKSYAAVLSELINALSPELGKLMMDANNVLALEYIKQISRRQCPLALFAVKRMGSAHDDMIPQNGFASAKALRNALSGSAEQALCLWQKYTPEQVFSLYQSAITQGNYVKNREKYELLCFGKLIGTKANDFISINGVNQGLENRLENAVKNSRSLEELFDGVKSKRFTHSRIRRVVLSSALGIKKRDLENGVSYIRVLGCNETGKALLREIKANGSLPIITNISQTNEGSLVMQRDACLDANAALFYELCKLTPTEKNPEYRVKPYLLRE